MGRKGVTAVDVVTACVELKRQGRSVGVRNLRLELARGSYGTIAKCLRQLALVETLEGDSASGGKHHFRRLGYKQKRSAGTEAAGLRGISGGA
jgi:hypothetical protein